MTESSPAPAPPRLAWALTGSGYCIKETLDLMGAGSTPHIATFGVTRSGEDLVIAPFRGFRVAPCRGGTRGDVIDPDRVAGVVRNVTASGRAPVCTAM